MPTDPRHGFLNVQIMVDGHPLEEYDDPDAVTDTTEISKYVEAPSDKDFWFRITELEKTTAPIEDLRIWINIDGVWARGNIFDQSQYSRGHVEDITHNLAGQKFHFAALHIDEDNVAPKSKRAVAAAKKLGVIRIEVTNVRVGTKCPYVPPRPLSAKTKVSEKMLKGSTVSHAVSYGKPAATKLCQDYWTCIDLSPIKVATFTFRYRSLKSLKTIGIVPSTPSPEPEVAVEEEAWERQPTMQELRDCYRQHVGKPREELIRIKMEKASELRKQNKRAAPSDDDEVSFLSTKPTKMLRMPTSDDVVIDLTN